VISYGKQLIDNEDISNVLDVLKSDFLTMGPQVELFESKLEEVTKSKTFVVSSGTAALHSAFFGIGIQPGDEVITPPNTFIATQATALNLGAKIVFADIQPNTGLISVESVEKLITPKTKAIVLVDYAGQPCDIDVFRDLIKGKDIYLIQDAAHSLGSTYKGEPVGSTADVTTFSFFPTKNITTGEGGAVSTKIDRVFEKAKTFSKQGVIREAKKFENEDKSPWVYEVHDPGLNYRLSDIHCALGISQLSKIWMFKKHRAEIFNLYNESLGHIPQVQPIKRMTYADPMWHFFPLLTPPKHRLDLFQHLVRNGIGVQVNYIPVVLQPVFRKLGADPQTVPNSLNFYEREISLPLHLGVSKSEVMKISGIIEEFFNGRN
jgi:dTDP-4-amino-4,6-dideoxygalactose transaminase